MTPMPVLRGNWLLPGDAVGWQRWFDGRTGRAPLSLTKQPYYGLRGSR